MTSTEALEHIEKGHFSGNENDVDPPCSRTMVATEATSVAHRGTAPSSHESVVVGAGGECVSGGESAATAVGAQVVAERPKGKRKCRRGRSKAKQRNQSHSSKPYAWKMPVAGRRSAASHVRSSIVPYNTNKFLMEDHMAEMQTPKGRTRDSSFSVDSDENYFCSLPEDEEEFLTKEFSSVYENAKCERLDGLTKSQLIQEYLQLEANFDMVSKRLTRERHADAKEQRNHHEFQNRIRTLEEQIHKLTEDNMDLSRQLEFYRSNAPPPSLQAIRMVCSSSEDSESDSSTSSSSSSSSSSEDEQQQTSMHCDEDEEARATPKAPLCNGFSHSLSPPHLNGGGPELVNGQHALSPNPQSPSQYNPLSPRG